MDRIQSASTCPDLSSASAMQASLEWVQLAAVEFVS